MACKDYLATLNPEQRRAVEHGVTAVGPNIAGPLLVIAGAGSGKTNTLAHRVAHLIVHGADPSRILLLTFSRRAAAEMERRAERIIAAALGVAGLGTRSPISWAGTFHAVGARLLRMYAGSVGLDPSFTIHDRADSADLINLVRHEQRLSEKAKRFPLKDTCLAIRAVNHMIAAAGKRADLGRIHPHMLRHSCGYALANKGQDFRLIQDWLGHRDPKHTSRYTRVAARRLEGVWD
jgi:superfamily I DNA/RNA helicase